MPRLIGRSSRIRQEMQDVLAAGFVPEKADPKAKSKALHGRVQKGAGGTFTDQLPPVARQLDREMSELFLFLPHVRSRLSDRLFLLLVRSALCR